MKNKGFTLIELLVVISIISLLSTVVMASLQSARTKAQEAAIKSDLQSIKTQAEISYGKMGDYSTAETEIAPILEHINNSGGTAVFYSFDHYSIVPQEYKHYAASVRLNSDTTKNWSVSDSNNISVWDIKDTKINGTVGSEKMNWDQANTACTNKAGRIPTIEELKSLYDSYGNTPDSFMSDFYWSATAHPSSPDYAWAVAMVWSGTIGDTSKRYSYQYVRCVR